MNNRRISSREAEELASGRVPSARRDLEPLAALMEDYRRAATTQSRIQPSAALAARLDLGNTPELPLKQESDSGRSNAALRAGSGLLGAGLAVLIVLGAASGAAALVGSAGMLPPDAQDAFDDLVSVIVPTEGAGDGTTDDNGEAPSDTLPDTGESTDAPEGAAEPTPEPSNTPAVEDNFGDRVAEIKDETESGREFGDQVSDEAKNNGNNSGNGNGNSGSNGNSGNGTGNSGSNGNSGTGNGNSGSNGNSGNGNSGNGKGNNGKND